MINIKTSLFNSTTDDTAIVIDLLRASTTICVALENFNKIIAVGNDDDAFRIKEKYDDVVLAGERNLETIEGYDINNSPTTVKDYHADVLVLNTTNGTQVIENIKKHNSNVNILIGSSINARAVASKALSTATDEIELIMAGRRKQFNIEDCVGAGLIIHEIISEAKKHDIKLELEESALACMLLTEDKEHARELIANSKAADRLVKLDHRDDVEICCGLNTIDKAAVYKDGIITRG